MLFGANASRLAAHYRLAVDIDAMPTKEWDSGGGLNPAGVFAGFNPIGGG